MPFMLEEKEFKKAESGRPIKADDWNEIQIRAIREINNTRRDLRNMTYTSIMTNLLSSEGGESYRLDEPVRDEVQTFGQAAIGPITKQWIALPEEDTICNFGIMDFVDTIYYWASATNGDREVLRIILHYRDGGRMELNNVYINDIEGADPQSNEQNNPFLILASSSKTSRFWFKYGLQNPRKDEDVEITYITFLNSDRRSVVRIGNVLHIQTRVRETRPVHDAIRE